MTKQKAVQNDDNSPPSTQKEGGNCQETETPTKDRNSEASTISRPDTISEQVLKKILDNWHDDWHIQYDNIAREAISETQILTAEDELYLLEFLNDDEKSTQPLPSWAKIAIKNRIEYLGGKA